MLSVVAALAVLQSSPAEIPLTKGSWIGGVVRGGRIPFPTDAVQAELHQKGFVSIDDRWKPLDANAEGWFQAQGINYVHVPVESAASEVKILEAAGHSMVYVNGVPRGGDPYGYGYLRLPIELKAGRNELLFAVGRGRVKGKLVAAEGPAELNPADLTIPDVLVGEESALKGAVVVMNNTPKAMTDLQIETSGSGFTARRVKVPTVPAMTIRKVPFEFKADGAQTAGDTKLSLRLFNNQRTLDSAQVDVRIRTPQQHYKRTFVSDIDGSVQYFAVSPALKASKSNALVLTLHGASVEALNQAQAYKPKDWVTVVAATNRRPFGFDWEDWGRMDAMEVLRHAKKMFPHDPARVHLTGHSMGGHGTWSVGSLFPYEFATIAPSAGWISFWSYGGGWEPREPTPVEAMLRRSANISDTLAREDNLLIPGVYVLHGDKDDNVPVTQARRMKEVLEGRHKDFQYHEQPEAGHWWGDECVDWPGIFAMMERRKLNSKPKSGVLVTHNPGVSGKRGTFYVDQQERPLEPSRIEWSENEAFPQHYEINAWNTTRIGIARDLTVRHLRVNGKVVKRFEDHQRTVMVERSKDLFVEFHNGEWVLSSDKHGKTAATTGPFKEAFKNRMIFVYGTRGNAEENAWAYNKARFDAETWYYRGNGAVDVMSDEEFLKDRSLERNVILFGNPATNRAFGWLLPKSPLRITKEGVEVGDRKLAGSIATLFTYPRDAGESLLAIVGGSDLKAMRLTDRMPYFVSGVHYPDWTVYDANVLTEGSKAVLGAGFWSNGWRHNDTLSAWKPPAAGN